MKAFYIFIIFLYTLIFSVLGAFLIALSIRPETINLLSISLTNLSNDMNLRLYIGIFGLSIIIVNLIITQLSIGKFQKRKTIQFDNPFGPVSVSLSAIEEYIKKLTQEMPEIKDIKSNVIAIKKGIEVISKATIFSDANIPEITERIQNKIRSNLQDMLGIEGEMTIKLHVVKIQQRKKTKEKDTDKISTDTPENSFHGEFEYGS